MAVSRWVSIVLAGLSLTAVSACSAPSYAPSVRATTVEIAASEQDENLTPKLALERAAARYRSLRTYSDVFSRTIRLNGTKDVADSLPMKDRDGTSRIWFVCDEKRRFRLESGSGMIVSDEATIWLVNKELAQYSVQPRPPRFDLRSFGDELRAADVSNVPSHPVATVMITPDGKRPLLEEQVRTWKSCESTPTNTGQVLTLREDVSSQSGDIATPCTVTLSGDGTALQEVSMDTTKPFRKMLGSRVAGSMGQVVKAAGIDARPKDIRSVIAIHKIEMAEANSKVDPAVFTFVPTPLYTRIEWSEVLKSSKSKKSPEAGAK